MPRLAESCRHRVAHGCKPEATWGPNHGGGARVDPSPGAPWRGYGILFEIFALPGDWFPLGAADLAGAAPLPGPIEHRCFRCWTLADCGHPLIDAQLRELLATGYLSNRGRQWVAWWTPISPGAKNSTPMAFGWLTPGRANSLGPMISMTAGSGLRQLATSPPMATASWTCAAMFGSGPALPIRCRPVSRSAGSSKADPICVPIITACVIARRQ